MLKNVDVAIIGGGITGCGVALNLAAHGMSGVILEAKDRPCSETSAKSSKMLHGGIRYLKNGDFSLVREALLEKNFWCEHAPSWCRPHPFLLPVFPGKFPPLTLLHLGLSLYDFLAKNKQHQHQILNRPQTQEKLGEILRFPANGAGLYYDAIMDDQLLGIELYRHITTNYPFQLISNYPVSSIEKRNSYYLINGEYQANFVILTLGPFLDQFMNTVGKCLVPSYTPKLRPSKGIHIWVDKKFLPIKEALVVPGENDRVIFLIPHSNHLLVGTTESPPPPSFSNVAVTKTDIQSLLLEVNHYLKYPIKETDVLDCYAGIRPLVFDQRGQGQSTTKISRVEHTFQFAEKLFAIAGGKYTTFRVMSNAVTEHLCRISGIPFHPNKSLEAVPYAGQYPSA